MAGENGPDLEHTHCPIWSVAQLSGVVPALVMKLLQEPLGQGEILAAPLEKEAGFPSYRTMFNGMSWLGDELSFGKLMASDRYYFAFVEQNDPVTPEASSSTPQHDGTIREYWRQPVDKELVFSSIGSGAFLELRRLFRICRPDNINDSGQRRGLLLEFPEEACRVETLYYDRRGPGGGLFDLLRECSWFLLEVADEGPGIPIVDSQDFGQEDGRLRYLRGMGLIHPDILVWLAEIFSLNHLPTAGVE
jgi:hypothetical protein